MIQDELVGSLAFDVSWSVLEKCRLADPIGVHSSVGTSLSSVMIDYRCDPIRIRGERDKYSLQYPCMNGNGRTAYLGSPRFPTVFTIIGWRTRDPTVAQPEACRW